MNPSMLRPKTQLLLAIVVPLACVLLAALLVCPAVSRLRMARREIEKTQGTIQQKKLAISQAEAIAGGRSLALAVALPTEEEPITFLKQFAAVTLDSGATLVSVRARSRPVGAGVAGTSQSAAPAAPAAPPVSGAVIGQGQRPVVPPAVMEVTDEATVEGRFSDILSLIIRLENFERILSVSQCRISATGKPYPNLQATFLLSRFVAAPEPIVVPAAPAAVGPAAIPTASVR